MVCSSGNTPAVKVCRALLPLAATLLFACSDEPAQEARPPMPTATLPGVYAGEFPCDGCAGIDATLWLRADGRFIFRQQYAATAERDTMDVFSLGRWHAAENDYAIELRGKGPVRTFERSGGDTLTLRTVSTLPHELLRDTSQAVLAEPMRMHGRMRLTADGAAFTECLTGLSAPVSNSADYRRFRHQLRSANRSGQEVPVELIGRFAWADDDSPQEFFIVQFVTIKPDEDCQAIDGRR
jgi:hypothetical protein